MKRSLFFLIVAVLPAPAQWRQWGPSPVRPTGFFGVGVSAPVNPAASHLDAGWNLAGGVGVTNDYVGIMFDGMFTDFGITHDALVRQGARSGSQRFWALTVDPIFHVNERGPIDFYVTGGGGLYSQITQYRAPSASFGQSSRRYDLISSDHIYKPGVNAGAGFSFSFGDYSNLKIFAEARYHHIFTGGSGASLIPVTVGVRF
jgi:hypothetical protein